MTVTYPISVADIFGMLRIGSVQFDLPDSLQQSQSAGGEIFTAKLGTRLWRGSVTLSPGRDIALIGMEARLSVLREPGASFFAYDPRKQYPQNDPTGSILTPVYAGTPPKIAGLRNNNELKIDGLPAGFHLRRGDMLSYTYGSNPVRYALHQVTFGSIADGSGVTNFIDVTPAIRPGAVVGARVELIRPFCKAVMIPNTWQGSTGTPGGVSSGAAFQFIQTLR